MFQLILAVLLPLSIYGAETEEANWRIVNYWSEWCAPCRIEIPMFNELSEQLSSSNVRIVGVNFDEDPREVTLDIADELGIEFPTLTLEQVEELDLRPPDIMPTTYILSPTNEVAAKLIGMQSKADILGQLMQLGLTVQSN
ncbi:MAG: TlpA disulfide reductase family protein [Pseudomonadota bacterium]|jgi:thiol-disulfide isomerase/thioredoxin|nr:TlpA disulfide reductase family protein [Pseudomonadota bacterium]MEE3144046.1 TlpA disulfide reductase family protein [Pseudomonadota bacterium]|tara:strand:- start:129 stop:551 length:423 start_codon:yes stop_codon:yes gene_type:complete